MTKDDLPESVLEMLPHRYPFLLVDRILERSEGRVRGLKNVTINEPFFQGHFPGAPVMPGVLIVEAMAQTGGCLFLGQVEERDKKFVYFAGIDKCRFRRPVFPGDQLIFDVEVVSVHRGFVKIHGRATVDGELVCEADLVSVLVDK